MRVIVVGLGCSGSAAAAHLAQRGAEVIGLEQFTIGNERGSSGHQSRAFRLAYAEHPGYVPLLQRARELWMEINEAAPEAVFHASGGLYISRAEAGFVWINEVGLHFLGAPFGGVKQSGIGREEGIGELMSFTHEKNIHVNLAGQG